MAGMRLREEGGVLDVPVRPSPKAVGRYRRIVVDVERRALLAQLFDVVDRVLVGVVRRPAGLEVVPGVRTV